MEELLAQYYAEQRQALADLATCLLHGDRMAAEDVVQTTFLRLLSMSHPCQFRGHSVAPTSPCPIRVNSVASTSPCPIRVNSVANVVRMNLFEEKPVSEISETLGIKYKTIENHLQTGRRQLRQYLRKVV